LLPLTCVTPRRDVSTTEATPAHTSNNHGSSAIKQRIPSPSFEHDRECPSPLPNLSPTPPSAALTHVLAQRRSSSSAPYLSPFATPMANRACRRVPVHSTLVVRTFARPSRPYPFHASKI